MLRKRATAPAQVRPAAPPGARNLVVVVLDSCRYDSWVAAAPSTLGRLGPVERRFSYASWTAPSHHNLLMGLLPHTSPTHVHASEYYKADFVRYGERLGVADMNFDRLLPSLHLPTFLRATGYRTHALVSMPVLNPATVINRDFDTYALMPTHNDMAAMIDRLRFDDDGPSFVMMNVGETHYPYAAPGDTSPWPRLSGLHGAVKHLGAATEAIDWFTPTELAELRARQVAAVTYLDGVFATLFDRLPADTWVVVTADHGELFGEDDYFGHGPVNHEKVFEVPFVEGMVPR